MHPNPELLKRLSWIRNKLFRIHNIDKAINLHLVGEHCTQVGDTDIDMNLAVHSLLLPWSSSWRFQSRNLNTFVSIQMFTHFWIMLFPSAGLIIWYYDYFSLFTYWASVVGEVYSPFGKLEVCVFCIYCFKNIGRFPYLITECCTDLVIDYGISCHFFVINFGHICLLS